MFVEPPIIDTHAHIFTHRMPFVENAWTRPGYEYPVEQYLADLDRHGVSFGVVTAASLYGDYNDYTLWALSRHKRLRATVMLGPDTEAAAIHALRAQGVVGVRMQWKMDAEPPDLRGYVYSKFINRLADNGMQIELNASGAQLAQVLPQLEGRGVDLVIDHFGMLRAPDGMEGAGFHAILRAVAGGRTWVKISAGFRLAPELRAACTARLLAEAGPERLLWGSDAPFVGKESEASYSGALETFCALVPDPATRRKISDTGVKLFFG